MVFYEIDKIAYDPCCKYCNNSFKPYEYFNWGFLKKVVIINLIDRVDRKRCSEIQTHKVGLCQIAEFFRPERDPNGFIKGCFESHRTICINALNNKKYPILILEDDFYFDDKFSPKKLNSIVKQMSNSLPDDYETLFLGGYFIYLFPVNINIYRARGVTAHSYIANKPFLELVKNTPFKKSKFLGKESCLDGYYSMKKKTKQFTVYPPVCYQQELNSDHYSSKKNIYNTSNLLLNKNAMKIIPRFIIYIELFLILFICVNLSCKSFKKYNKYILYLFGVIIIVLLLWVLLFQSNVFNKLVNL